MKKNEQERLEVAVSLVVKYFRRIVVAALVLIALTGIYKVDSSEVAVVLRFGHLSGSTRAEQIKEPGLHFAFPYIVDEVIKVPVQKVQEMTVKTHYTKDTKSENVKNVGYVITGDSNLVQIKAVVKYRIADPVAYALRVNDIESTVDGIVSGEMTAVAASMTVDDILTAKRNETTQALIKNVQAVFDELGLGLTLTNIELPAVSAPAETTDAFESVISASVKKQTLIQEANDYTASRIPQAEAEAQSLVSTAKTNSSSRQTKASEEVAVFNGLFERYKASPEVVMNSTFRQRVAAALKKTGGTVIIPDGGNGVKVILP